MHFLLALRSSIGKEVAYAAFAGNRHFIVIKTHKGRAKARGCSKLHPSITLMRNFLICYVFFAGILPF